MTSRTAEPTGVAWDELTTLVDHVASGRAHVPAPAMLEDLVVRCQAERSIDSELRVPETSRWIVGLLVGHGHLRHHLGGEGSPEGDSDHLRMILTRWLHPARPR